MRKQKLAKVAELVLLSLFCLVGIYIVSGSLIPRLLGLVFLSGVCGAMGARAAHAASRLVVRLAAQAQGMSSSRRDSGQRLTSLVRTSAK